MSTKRKSPRKPTVADVVKAHKMYVSAINSNNTDRVMKCYDKGAVVMQPDGPQVQGTKPIRKWVADYFKAYKTHWVKISKVIWVAGDYGFDQGHDTAVDKPRDGGKDIHWDVKGILIYKWQKSGKFLVYRDIWNNNKAAQG